MYLNFIPFIAELYLITQIYHISIIRLTGDRCLGCFHFGRLLIMLLSIFVCNFCVDIYVFSSCGDITRSRIDHIIETCLIFWGIAKLLSTVTAPFYIPTIAVSGNTPLPKLSFLFGPRRCNISPWIYLHFPIGRCWVYFHMLVVHVCVFIYKNLYSHFLSLSFSLKWDIGLFIVKS